MAKGKTISFDPRKDKRLMIFTSRSFPSWQGKYIDIVREAFDGLAINMKAVSARVSKMGEAKKAMPFVQALKRKIDSSVSSLGTLQPSSTTITTDKAASDRESKAASPVSKAATAVKEVFDRTLPFDEHEILTAMAPGLKQTLQKCRAVEIILVDGEGADKDGASGDGITGVLVAGDGNVDDEDKAVEQGTQGQDGKLGKRRTNLPPVALGAEPGAPTFYFENI